MQPCEARLYHRIQCPLEPFNTLRANALYLQIHICIQLPANRVNNQVKYELLRILYALKDDKY